MLQYTNAVIAGLGLEPRTSAYEADVLPLHYPAIYVALYHQTLRVREGFLHTSTSQINLQRLMVHAPVELVIYSPTNKSPYLFLVLYQNEEIIVIFSN